MDSTRPIRTREPGAACVEDAQRAARMCAYESSFAEACIGAGATLLAGADVSDPVFALLRAELGQKLGALVEVAVQLSFHEDAALFLRAPRQRLKLVRYVVEQARAFAASELSERRLDWRMEPMLVAVKSLRFSRVAG